MGEKEINIRYQAHDDVSTLSPAQQELLALAKTALPHSYAPYSSFEVAAALRLSDGKLLTGTNQENAAYGLTLCAEQNVLAMAGSQHPNVTVESIAITARYRPKVIDHPITPCGACRQVLMEHQDRHASPIEVILQGESGPILIFSSAGHLLPLSFSSRDLLVPPTD